MFLTSSELGHEAPEQRKPDTRCRSYTRGRRAGTRSFLSRRGRVRIKFLFELCLCTPRGSTLRLARQRKPHLARTDQNALAPNALRLDAPEANWLLLLLLVQAFKSCTAVARTLKAARCVNLCSSGITQVRLFDDLARELGAQLCTHTQQLAYKRTYAKDNTHALNGKSKRNIEPHEPL
jgi:hypothetical protein